MTHQRARSKFAAHLACRIAPTNNQTRFDATLSRLRVRLGLCCLTIALTTLTFEKLAFADPDPVPDAGTTPDAEPTPGDPMSTSGTTGNTADEVWKPGTIAPSFRAQRRVGEITIDGDPREASWQGSRTTIPFYDFRSTPKWKRSREPTEVSVQYDDKNLYIAIWQNLDKPGEVNTSLYAGDWFERTDYVCLQVDAQGSGQTSRGFCVTPANQRITLMLLDSGASGVGRTEYFDYRIRRSATGLSGEWALPWSSLGVRGTKPKLTPRIAIGVNLSRAGKRFYSAPHQTGSDFHIPDFNPVTGIETISTPRGILINATLIGGYHSPEPGLPRWVDWTGPNNDVETRASLSARIPISTSASVGVTIAPEFSSATIDPVFANPSPFPFFQEERREFFLQKPELFAFGSPFSEQLFYSRTIGLVSPTFGNREIPLLGGIQGFVEHDKLQIGVLATQGTEVTVDGTDIPGTTDAVVRALAYPKPNLRVGGMYTLRYPTSGAPAHAAGVDLRLGQGDGRIQSNAWFAGSDADDKQGFTSHLDSNLSTDEFSMGAAYSYTSSKFSPPLGFYRYPGSQRLAGNAAYSPRVQTPGVEKIRLSVDGESLSDNTGKLFRSALGFGGSVGFLNYASASVNFSTVQETLSSTFDAGGGVVFAAGESLNHTVQVSASTPQTAGVQLTVSAAQGGLFSGSQQRVNSGLRAELGPLSMNANYTFLRLRGPPDPLDLNGDGQLGEGSSKTHLLGFGLTILPNERFTVTSQVQANNTFLAGQLIVSWEFRRFDFLQFVYSEDGALENAFTADVANRAALVKLSWHLGL